MLTEQNAREVIGTTAYSTDGQKIGKVGQLFLDDETGRPEFVTVNTGLFGTNETFIPVSEAEFSGDRLTLPFSKDKVKDAPNVDADGELSTEEEQRLYEHYGRSDYGEWEPGSDRTGGGGPVGRDVSGPTTDDAMTRSEEELSVGKTQRETGRARLRKYVVTENVQQTVPVEREEVRVEREPITDANRDRATAGPDISEEEHEVTLHAEEPVVEKRTVPKERVRLDKETVTDERTVDEQVRKERIEEG
jgi:uncharacterized protein (TIGR02271 family)